MAGRVPTIVLKVLADVAGAQKGLTQTAGAVGKVQGAAAGMALPATVAAGAILALGADAASSASDVEQAWGAVESVFGKQADAVKELATASAKATGLSSAEYAQMAATIGAQLKNMGVDQSEIVGRTEDLINKGSDLAATFGGPTSDAVSALSALMRGERDPIERYGVSIKQADINAAVAAQGLVTAKGAAKGLARAQADVTKAQEAATKAHAKGTPAQKKAADAALAQAQANLAAASKVKGLDEAAMKAQTTQATLGILTKQTADATGAFARETDTAAHAQQVSAASMENAKAAMGEALLPVVVALSEGMSELATFVQENTGLVQGLVVVVGALAVGIIALNVAFKAYQAAQVAIRAVTVAWTGIQWALNAALAANPLGLIVIAVLAVVAAIILAYQNSETFRRIVQTVFAAVGRIITTAVAAIKAVFGTLAAILGGPFDVWLKVVRRVVDAIMGLFRGLASFIGGLFDKVSGLAKKIGDAIGSLPSLPFGLAAVPPAAAMATPGLRAAGRSTGGGSGRITVNVYTTGDSMEAEQAVVRALRRANRLTAGVVSAPALGWTSG